MAEARPTLKLPLSVSDKLVNSLTFAGLVALWFWVFFLYRTLPDTIPMHYNLAGEIDRYGSKSFSWFMPALTTVLVSGLHVLNRYPHTFNYWEEITRPTPKRIAGWLPGCSATWVCSCWGWQR
jgi:hypothetical protein